MNKPVTLPEDDKITDLATIPAETALAVLTDTERFDAFYAKVKTETDAHVPDLKTAKGREAIKSLAFKVTKTKTAIDAAGKALTEEWRSQTQKVDAARKAIRDKLDALRDEVRQPLTEWEAAEEARIAECQAALDGFKAASVVAMAETAADVSGRLADLEATRLDRKVFGELMPIAEAAVEHAKMVLQAAVARLTQEEADRAELERLRSEARAREEREAAEAAERQRQEQAAAEARRREEAEAARLRDEQARRDRQAEEAAEAASIAAAAAADAARQEAEAAARAEQARRDQEAQAQLAEERRQREAAQAVAQRLEDEKVEAARQAAADQAAEAKRAANRAHQSKVLGEAKAAIMAAGGVGEEAAKKIVLAIGARAIPHVSLAY